LFPLSTILQARLSNYGSTLEFSDPVPGRTVNKHCAHIPLGYTTFPPPPWDKKSYYIFGYHCISTCLYLGRTENIWVAERPVPGLDTRSRRKLPGKLFIVPTALHEKYYIASAIYTSVTSVFDPSKWFLQGLFGESFAKPFRLLAASGNTPR
jgi:hypothetical protein